jgi:hypothetical protein
MLAITHAPMGVHSVTEWIVREENDGLVLEEKGEVTSNRMLMGFIKTTFHESHEKLVKDFVAMVEKTWAEREGTGKSPEGEGQVEPVN